MVRKGQTGSQKRLYIQNILEPPIIIHIGKGEVKGNWINTQCTICFRHMAYWSKKGIPLERYKFPICEECK